MDKNNIPGAMILIPIDEYHRLNLLLTPESELVQKIVDYEWLIKKHEAQIHELGHNNAVLEKLAADLQYDLTKLQNGR